MEALFFAVLIGAAIISSTLVLHCYYRLPAYWYSDRFAPGRVDLALPVQLIFCSSVTGVTYYLMKFFLPEILFLGGVPALIVFFLAMIPFGVIDSRVMGNLRFNEWLGIDPDKQEVELERVKNTFKENREKRLKSGALLRSFYAGYWSDERALEYLIKKINAYKLLTNKEQIDIQTGLQYFNNRYNPEGSRGSFRIFNAKIRL